MQAVQQPAQVGEIHVVGLAGADVVQKLAEAPDLMRDLGVRPAHRGGHVAAAEQPVQGRVQLLLLSLLVRPDLPGQQLVHPADLLHRRGRRGRSERVRGGPQLPDAGPDALVLRLEPPGERGVLVGEAETGGGGVQRAQRVVVVWGDSDRMVDPEYGRAFAAAIPKARFELLTDTGHMPQVETPGQLLEAIR